MGSLTGVVSIAIATLLVAAACQGPAPYKTMMLTWKYGLPCFVVPVMFTQPDGLAILWRDTTVVDAAVASISAIVGIIAIVSGLAGYLLKPTMLIERVMLFIADVAGSCCSPRSGSST
ncbi:MAG: hypothetical protein NVS9B6_09330 [Candidatus Limnocylindrales bacterium]